MDVFDTHVDEFTGIYLDAFEEEISRDEAVAIINRLVVFYELLQQRPKQCP